MSEYYNQPWSDATQAACDKDALEWCRMLPEAKVEGNHVVHPPAFPHSVVFVVRRVLFGQTVNYQSRIEY